MLRICDRCGAIDDLPREVVNCAITEAPPVNKAMVDAVIRDESLDPEVKASVVADLHDNTLMLRHLPDVECVPFEEN
jgi:hypothetical protein